MNIIFTVIFTLSMLIFTIFNPNGSISAMTDGATKGITLSIGLISIYSVWSGILQVAQDANLITALSNKLKPIIKKLFKTNDGNTESQIAVNLSANLLGMGGIATPSGISAATLLNDSKNYDGACLLLVLASTSIQIIPTTVISLRQSFGSVNPFDVFLPSLLATIFSTGLGIFLCVLTRKRGIK